MGWPCSAAVPSRGHDRAFQRTRDLGKLTPLGSLIRRELTRALDAREPRNEAEPILSSEIMPLRLPKRFYRRDPIIVAQELLGMTLVRIDRGVRLAGRIVETEAYLGTEDRASHSWGGRRTARNEAMYGDGGTAYVFLNYGIHYLLNVVTEQVNQPSAVLIRALEPLEGLVEMQARRPTAKRTEDLASGPGKLGAALAIDLRLNQADFVDGPELWIERPRSPRAAPPPVKRTPRIGVDYAGEWALAPLRFVIAGSPCLSAPNYPRGETYSPSSRRSNGSPNASP